MFLGEYQHSLDAKGRAGKMVPFATGFAGPTPDDRVVARAAARPNGLAVTDDGALLVVASKGGRLWRISYASSEASPAT